MANELEIYWHEIPLLMRGILLMISLGALVAIAIVFGLFQLQNPIEVGQWFIGIIVATGILLVLVFSWLEQAHHRQSKSNPLEKFASLHSYSLFFGNDEDDFLAVVGGPVNNLEFKARIEKNRLPSIIAANGHTEATGLTVGHVLARLGPSKPRHFGLDGRLVRTTVETPGFEIRSSTDTIANQGLDRFSIEALQRVRGLIAFRIAPEGLEIIADPLDPLDDQLEMAWRAIVAIRAALSKTIK